MSYRDKISGIGIIIKNKENLPYGNKDRGRLVPSEKGRRAIFVPSFGTMEKEEVDYIVEASQDKEDERIKKNEKSNTRERLEQVVEVARRAPRGKRAIAAQEIIDEGG